MFEFTGLLVSFGIGIAAAAFAETDPVLIYRTTVPQLVEYRGYDDHLVAELLREHIRKIGTEAGTTRGESLSVFHAEESAIERLAHEIHLDGVITGLRDLLNLHRYSFELSIVNASNRLDFTLREGNGSLPIVSGGADDLKMVLHGQSVDGQLFTIHAEGGNDVPALIETMAERFVERVDPYVLTRYYFVKEYPSGNFVETLPMIKHSIEVLPPNEARWPLLLWGRIHFRHGNYDAAIEKYREALALDPLFVFPLLRWGEALVVQGQVEAGLELMRDSLHAVRVNDKLTRGQRIGAYEIAYRVLGDTLAAQGRDEEAYSAYIQGLEKSPEEPLLETSLATLYLRHGQFEPAVRLLRKVIPKHRNPSVPRKLLNQAFAELLEAEKAETSL